MVSNVTDITQQMSNPHALNKLGFRLGFLGRLTDLVNTVGFQISNSHRGNRVTYIAEWEHQLVEAEAIVKHLKDNNLKCSFDEFKQKCEAYWLSEWNAGKQQCMKESQVRLLKRIHTLQKGVIFRYGCIIAIFVLATHLIFPLIIEYLPLFMQLFDVQIEPLPK